MDVAVVPEHTASFADHHDEDRLEEGWQDEHESADYPKSDKLTIVQWTDPDPDSPALSASERGKMHHEDRTVNLISFSTSSENPKTPVTAAEAVMFAFLCEFFRSPASTSSSAADGGCRLLL